MQVIFPFSYLLFSVLRDEIFEDELAFTFLILTFQTKSDKMNKMNLNVYINDKTENLHSFFQVLLFKYEDVPTFVTVLLSIIF